MGDLALIKQVIYKSKLGHRSNYLGFFEECGYTPTSSDQLVLNSREKVAFITIEDHYYFFGLVCIIRNLLNRQTIGILLNPPVNTKGNKSFIKQRFLQFLRNLKNVRIITFVPSYTDPDIVLVANYWTYDIEFFHLSADCKSRSPMNVIYDFCFVGGVSSAKNIEGYYQLAKTFPLKKFLVAGRFDESVRNYIQLFQELPNVELVPRRLSDADFSGYICASHSVWCSYAEWYDQSSGLFGHALRYNKIPIIRAGSKLCSISDELGVIYSTFDNIHLETHTPKQKDLDNILEASGDYLKNLIS